LLRRVTVIWVVALAWTGNAAAFSKTEVTLFADDGTPLAATAYRPDGEPPAGGWPGILMLHGLGGNRLSMNQIAEQSFANEGYAVLTYDARGHGSSGGLFTAAGPREIRDVRNAFDWLAARADVADARIGVWGISYGGGQALRALVDGVPFAAAEVVATWTDLYTGLVAGGLSKSGAVFGFLNSVSAARTAPEVAAIREPALASTNLPAVNAFAAARSTVTSLGSVRTPTYVFQGRRDFIFGLEQGIATYRGLGGPKRLYVGAFGHAPSTFPGADAAHMFTDGSNWFARFLKGMPNGIDTRPPVWLSADPPPFRELAGAQYAGLPPTRAASFVSARARSRISGSGFFTRPLGRTTTLLETFGAPTVRLTASGTFPHVVLVLKAVTPDGRELVVSEGGAKVALRARPRTIAIRMISQATTIPRGARLSLRVGPTSGDLLYIAGVPSRARLDVRRIALTMPVLRRPVSG
jgi:alpha-beta hydrolase superfamily lysophospholipase